MAEVAGQTFPGSRRLELCSYLLLWTGAMALLPVPDVPPQLVLTFCLLIAPSWFLNVPAQRSASYRVAWRSITALFIILSLLDWYANGRALYITLVSQMCFFQMYKAYNTKGYADYLVMGLFATLMVVFCALISKSVFFLVILVPFISVGTAFLVTLNLSRQYLVARPRRRPEHISSAFTYQVAARDLAAQNLAMPRLSWLVQTAMVFVLGAALFYALPRKHAFSLTYQASPGSLCARDPIMSGLSSGLSLRHFVQIKRDPTRVVRLTFPDKTPMPRAVYLRAGTLEKIYNFEWLSITPRTASPKRDAYGVFWFEQIDDAHLGLLVRHTVEYLNGVGRQALALPGLVAIEPEPDKSPRIEAPIRYLGALPPLRRYNAFSWRDGTPPKEELKPVSDGVWAECLDLPEALRSPRLSALAAEITSGYDDDLTRARAIERFLRSRFGYTLNIEPLNGPPGETNPIEQFLFHYRQANCEVFASTMVILCRDLGIPSRIAIGYSGGEPGDSPNEIYFRNQDAHAWAEVWAPGKGWTLFDPTPPPPLEVYSGRLSFKKLMEWFTALTARWNRLVVGYDRDTKMRWMSYLWEPFDRLAMRWNLDSLVRGRFLSRLRENLLRPEIVPLLLGLLAINLATALVYLRARRRADGLRAAVGGKARRNDPWRRFYRAAVAQLRGERWPRRPSQTPHEFLEALAEARSVDPVVVRPIVELYHRGRFGGAPWTRRTAQRADRLLHQLGLACSGPVS